jgi:hypothetical protein
MVADRDYENERLGYVLVHMLGALRGDVDPEFGKHRNRPSRTCVGFVPPLNTSMRSPAS